MIIHFTIHKLHRKRKDELIFLVTRTDSTSEQLAQARLLNNYVVVHNGVTRVESRHASCEGLEGTATAVFRTQLPSGVIGSIALYIPTTG